MITTTSNKNLSLNQFLETQLQLFKGHFLVTQTTMDEEAIHKMRLAIKRIRTICKLKKYIHFPSTLNKKVFEAMKTIFAVSGQLRDLQVQQTLLEQYSAEMKFSFTLFMVFFTEKVTTFTDCLNKTIHEINFDQFASLHTQPEAGSDIPENTSIEDESLDYVKFKIRKILQLIILPETNENVHALRKQVKQLFFVLQFLRDYFPENCLAEYSHQALNDVGNSLGKWHDRVVLKELVLEFTMRMGEDFIEENPDYQILMYVLEDEKRKFLKGLAVNLYLEMINLRYLLGERATGEVLTMEDEIHAVSEK